MCKILVIGPLNELNHVMLYNQSAPEKEQFKEIVESPIYTIHVHNECI